MKTSKVGIAGIKGFEKFMSKSYKCPAGVWTIGYGHTKGVKPGQVISEKQAEVLLEGDLLIYEKAIDSLHRTFTQSQFDALVSFSFNLGADTPMFTRIRAGQSNEQTAKDLLKYVYAGKQKLDGLVKRRNWEHSLFTRV